MFRLNNFAHLPLFLNICSHEQRKKYEDKKQMDAFTQKQIHPLYLNNFFFLLGVALNVILIYISGGAYTWSVVIKITHRDWSVFPPIIISPKI